MRNTKKLVIGMAAAASVLLVGCESPSPYRDNVNTKRGAVGGGLLGAAVGGIIGHQSGRGIEGAAIGAGAGALGGGVIGSSVDEQNARQRAAQSYYPPQQQYYPPPQQQRYNAPPPRPY